MHDLLVHRPAERLGQLGGHLPGRARAVAQGEDGGGGAVQAARLVAAKVVDDHLVADVAGHEVGAGGRLHRIDGYIRAVT